MADKDIERIIESNHNHTQVFRAEVQERVLERAAAWTDDEQAQRVWALVIACNNSLRFEGVDAILDAAEKFRTYVNEGKQ